MEKHFPFVRSFADDNSRLILSNIFKVDVLFQDSFTILIEVNVTIAFLENKREAEVSSHR